MVCVYECVVCGVCECVWAYIAAHISLALDCGLTGVTGTHRVIVLGYYIHNS